MSPHRTQPGKSTKGSETRKRAVSASSKDRSARDELQRERDEVVESRRIRRAVKHEFEEAQSRGLGVDEVIRRTEAHGPDGPILSGGDVDADWKRADVGEETVGGSVSTPDQDVVDELGEAAGVRYADNEPLDPEEKILRRDRERWELNPASSEDFREWHEPDEESDISTQRPKSAKGKSTSARTTAKPATPRSTQAKTTSPRSSKPAPTGAARKPVAAKPAARRTPAAGRGKRG